MGECGWNEASGYGDKRTACSITVLYLDFGGRYKTA
jgi:hypothetical protein